MADERPTPQQQISNALREAYINMEMYGRGFICLTNTPGGMTVESLSPADVVVTRVTRREGAKPPLGVFVPPRNKPQFKHGCQTCVFLGSYDVHGHGHAIGRAGDVRVYDLYFCPKPCGESGERDDVLARWGDGPDSFDYAHADEVPSEGPLRAALNRAIVDADYRDHFISIRSPSAPLSHA